ncbi:MAG: DNA-binding MarR family transcriptional regulator [Planctomycetota bacterium]|jgi:DNA-binding MarR family transcriptional regulator
MSRTRPELSRDAYLAIARVQDRLSADFQQLFKAQGLTTTQLNVLRILIGAKEAIPCQLVGERLIQRVPDVTRLLDRMEKEGLVERMRSADDRRVVLVSVTREGRKRCNRLNQPTLALHDQQMQKLSKNDLGQLEYLLAQLLH